VHVDRRAVTSAGQKAVLIFAHISDLHGQPHACERQDNGESEGRKVDHHAVPIRVLSLFPAFVFGERFVRVGRLRAARRALACAEAAGSEWDDPVVIVCRLGPLSCHVRFRFGRPVSRLYRRQCEISSKTEITFAAKLCAVTTVSAEPAARLAKKKFQ
jgi:hypothetical protein